MNSTFSAWSNPAGQAFRLYCIGPRRWCLNTKAYAKALIAGRRKYCSRCNYLTSRQHNFVGKYSVVSGCRSSTTNAILGCRYFQRKGVPRIGLVGCFFPRNGHIPDCVVFQLCRRLASRSLGPEVETDIIVTTRVGVVDH